MFYGSPIYTLKKNESLEIFWFQIINSTGHVEDTGSGTIYIIW
jgi:hypothetical protein